MSRPSEPPHLPLARTPEDEEDDRRLMGIFASLREQVIDVSRSFGDQVRKRVHRGRHVTTGLALGSLVSDVLVGLSNLLVDVGGGSKQARSTEPSPPEHNQDPDDV